MKTKIVTIVLVVLCFSCIVPERNTNATFQCNVLEVPRKGSPRRYRNERVRFALEHDSLKIHSRHIDLFLARNPVREKRLPTLKEVQKQFVFKDQSGEEYKVLYVEQTWKARLYLYLYIINLRYPAPIYLFTNDPNFNATAGSY